MQIGLGFAAAIFADACPRPGCSASRPRSGLATNEPVPRGHRTPPRDVVPAAGFAPGFGPRFAYELTGATCASAIVRCGATGSRVRSWRG
jgi:hypothetical protein